MNIITGTTWNLTEAFEHYVCIRIQFRNSVFIGATESRRQDKSYKEHCPIKQ